MAQTFAGEQYPDVQRFTLGATSVATQVNLPHTALKATVQFLGGDGYLATLQTLTDGGAIGTAYLTIPGDSPAQVFLGEGQGKATRVGKLFVAGSLGSLVCEILLEGGG